MSEEFDPTRRLYLTRDDEGRVTELRPAERNRPTIEQLPQLPATEFLGEHAATLGIDPEWLTGAARHGRAPSRVPPNRRPRTISSFSTPRRNGSSTPRPSCSTRRGQHHVAEDRGEGSATLGAQAFRWWAERSCQRRCRDHIDGASCPSGAHQSGHRRPRTQIDIVSDRPLVYPYHTIRQSG